MFNKYMTDEAMKKKIKKIIDREEGIAMVTNAMCRITDNLKEYSRLISQLKGELDMQARMAEVKRKGHAEGLAEGLEAATRNALAQGASIDFVNKITGLEPQPSPKGEGSPLDN